jgi:hypothetical protein
MASQDRLVDDFICDHLMRLKTALTKLDSDLKQFEISSKITAVSKHISILTFIYTYRNRDDTTARSAITQIAIGQHFFRNSNCSTQKMKMLKSD